MADYESVLCVKNTVHVYRIPPRPSNRGYRAADWKLDCPDWSGRMRVVAKGKDLFIKLEDKNSGELFAQCPVEQYPGVAVEAVMDSSRYFVLRIKDEGGRSAFIGIGFEDRGDSFDLNVSLQDHFKWIKNEEEAKKASSDLSKGPKLDLGFKEGQTIKINIGTKFKNQENSSPKARPKPSGGGGGGLGILPPPPGGQKLPAPPSGSNLNSLQISKEDAQQPSPQTNSSSNNSISNSSNVDFLLDFGNSDSASANSEQGSAKAAQDSSDPWGEFTGAGSSTANNWVQF